MFAVLELLGKTCSCLNEQAKWDNHPWTVCDFFGSLDHGFRNSRKQFNQF